MKFSIFLMSLFAAFGLAQAQTFQTIEAPGVQINYEARTSVVSSHTVSGYLLSWNVSAVGGTADFVVKHSTIAAADPNVNVSSTIYVLSGQSVSDKAVGRMKNAMILITRIDTPGTTVYVDMVYLAPRAPGAF